MIFEYDITDEQLERIKEIKKEYTLTDDDFEDAFIRFWSKDEIQIDGCLTVGELICLVKIMEYLQGE